MRLMIIGIDSLDRKFLHEMLPRLPNLRKMMASGTELEPESTLPPDSITAWATIYTGMTPSQHGMVSFSDPLDKIDMTVVREIDPSPIRGRTFWDALSREGKRVCIVNPHLGYPPWRVNGIMIGRANTRDNVLCEPTDSLPASILEKLCMIREVPRRSHSDKWRKINKVRQLIESEREAGLYLLKQEEWDLFFLYSSALDYVKHYFWSFCDPNDPAYPGENPFQGVIKEFYTIYDRLIGSISEAAGSDCGKIVISDHGHGMRPSRLVNLNRVLKDEGLFMDIQSSGSRRVSPRAFVKDSARDLAKRAVNDFRLGNLGMKLLRAFPELRKAAMSSSYVDWDSTKAYVTDQSGMKAYAYGGIVVRRDKSSSEVEYESWRERAIRAVSEVVDPETGRSIARICIRREHLYPGKYVWKYPDLVIVLSDGYGLGWDGRGPLFDTASIHNIAPGSHKMDTPVLIVPRDYIDSRREADNFSLADFSGLVQSIVMNSTSAPMEAKSAVATSTEWELHSEN